jgi:hypothetical protein
VRTNRFTVGLNQTNLRSIPNHRALRSHAHARQRDAQLTGGHRRHGVRLRFGLGSGLTNRRSLQYNNFQAAMLLNSLNLHLLIDYDVFDLSTTWRSQIYVEQATSAPHLHRD